ncbi:MAG: aldehyde dehydrogenase EutE [Candidatus Hydrogenedentota bacterium]|uniref:CoA-acylating propionaldehyde dehydrogenase n=1 Tax=Sumerlaea chitinivorans TaxID=2250252 RepID=A0A2Z4Y3M5_SUMC1|nr:CoA-acylating propionaldehyde dehydrogenase [Candidatus Sumerlaea chitinivorans]RMH25180.1 MAG: aldehyde dehydrogenase EutE [Candidatus Hydrogenedentota bacterium]GIX44240.1 MAG: aldehyde dehydrogenase [Candidatus Sumerlaea sp.]
MNVDEAKISAIVEEVVRRLKEQGFASGSLPQSSAGAGAVATRSRGTSGLRGVFSTIEEAIEAAWQSQKIYADASMETRKKVVAAIRQVGEEHKEDFARRIYEETKLGRIDHKIRKHEIVIRLTPGPEDLVTRCWSGDHGLTVEEYAPYGLIGAVTPVTHPVETAINNGISILSGGNTVVFNPHPASKRVFAYAIHLFNEAIYRATGLENLMTTIEEPTIETGKTMFRHPKVRVLLVTGGPGVVREALNSGKKCITAGPGNPPVVVDETAIIPKAAKDIIDGAGFDNNILCIGEKEVFVVESVADQLIAEMKKLGCVMLSREQISALAEKAFRCEGQHGSGKSCGGAVLNRDLVGRSPQVLARAIGLEVPPDCPMLIGETEFDNPWVQHEQMMMFLPIVRCRNFDEALDMAVKAEHGYGHTAVIHSLNVANMTKMGKAMNCSIFVKNGPSYAGLGAGGEGHTSFSIASPTGEGLTTARTFCRIRRCTLVDYLRIV